MPIRAFLFDLDGVIVDTAIYHYQAWKRLANELGFDISEDFNERLKGVSRMDSLDLILAHGNLALPDEEKAELASQKNQWYIDLVSRMTPEDVLPGVASFFAQIRKTRRSQGPLMIGLGSVSKNAPMILERIGLTDVFDSVVDGNSISRGKPDPEVFTKGAAELDVSPAECVVFEDAVAGVEAGKRAGMFVVGLGSPAVLTQADMVSPSLEQLTVDQVFDQIEKKEQ